jgi:hypothetical protein
LTDYLTSVELVELVEPLEPLEPLELVELVYSSVSEITAWQSHQQQCDWLIHPSPSVEKPSSSPCSYYII